MTDVLLMVSRRAGRDLVSSSRTLTRGGFFFRNSLSDHIIVGVGQICQKERENAIFKVPLRSIICFSFSLLHFNVWAPLCRMVYVQSSTQEGCFLVHLLQEEGFSLLTENLIMRGGAESRFGDITTSTEAIPGPAFTSVKLVASCANTWRIDCRLSGTYCVQQLKYWYILEFLMRAT